MAIFADTTGYGDAGLKGRRGGGFASHSLKPVHVARFPLGVKDLQSELRAARDAGADVVFQLPVGVENATIANGRKGPEMERAAGRLHGPCHSPSSLTVPRTPPRAP